MSDDARQGDVVSFVPFTGTQVELAFIERIQTFQVMESELDQLDALASAENQALGFFSGALGTFVSLLATLLSGMPTSPVRAGILVSVTLLAGVVALWFGLTWNRVRKGRPTLLKRIRERTRRVLPA